MVTGRRRRDTERQSFCRSPSSTTSGHSRWRVLQARTRPLWRRFPVGLRPQRRRKQTGTALPGDGVAGPQLAPANRSGCDRRSQPVCQNSSGRRAVPPEMEAQQEQRVQKVVTEQNTKALRAVLLCWRMVAEDRRLYRPWRPNPRYKPSYFQQAYST
eukprot:COSAG01_NODE_882_length_12931_cov_668.084788_4_plen_157_part_00